VKRIVAIGDLHSGHYVGLTPPSFQWTDSDGKYPKRDRIAKIQKHMWNWYVNKITDLGPIDLLIVNGDSIEGKGERSGGTELVSSSIQTQCDMAVQSIEVAKAKRIAMTFGTPYHVSPDGEDAEESIARSLNATIGGHEWMDCNGKIFDVKHHIGSSSSPQARHTAIAKDRLWNMLWSYHDGAPKADIILRSHVHYHTFCGGADWLAITLPALQGPGSKYGVRKCSGLVDFGMTVFDIDEKGRYTWTPILMDLKEFSVPVVMKI
jgi:hypothetical protein